MLASQTRRFRQDSRTEARTGEVMTEAVAGIVHKADSAIVAEARAAGEAAEAVEGETAGMTVSRKQRLRTLENEIRKGMEEFYYTGMKLKEIRDDELYKEDGFETWERYCKE